MPNWCENSLSVTGEKEDVDAFVEKAKGTGWSPTQEEENPLDCNKFIPMPKEVVANGYSAREDENISNGFDWENKYWGTKWGACEVDVYVGDTYAQYTFETAWCPFIPVVKAMIKQNPKLEFHLDYAEYGMMFKGSLSGWGGLVKAEDTTDIESEELCEMGWHDGSEQENSQHCDVCHDYCLKNDIGSDREPPLEQKIRIEINKDWNNEKTI